MITRRLLFAAALALGLSGPALAEDAQPLTIFAAASLKGPLDKVAAAYTANGGPKIVVSYAGSSALARQIGEGAPADLFISADLKWMDYLAQKDLIDASHRVNLLGNQLVLVAPSDSTISVTLEKGLDLASVLGPDGILAMGDAKAVPAGSYGKQALESLGAWAAIEKRVSNSDNVKAVTALVARGEAPLGIVYLTDALAEPKVKVVGTFPADSHKPIIYPAATIKASANPEAGEFFKFLGSDAALAIFKAAGFSTLPAS